MASAAAVEKLGPEVARIARMEGFEGHARAMELRLKRNRRHSDRHAAMRKNGRSQ
jgi:histidinol dehydrogenase